ncbi:MAG: bifunctional folylpolyglutamate synthase/dihydrofolate synthase [Lachnospiraceae bacterium]|nr:bifunctional folylpolyglutamate synthase/dihydrofolate synthase [Lachnospiraceae bacterium]
MITYEDAVNYILEIPKFSSKNSIEDTRRLLDEVYEDGTSKIIHVAGTNGKGSTSSYMNSILIDSGFSVGLFTSPHLVFINERIVVNGCMISNDEFLEAYNVIMKLVKKEGGEHHPSFFEFIFLMAMYHFRKKAVDYIILETGLGGRLDATNSVGKKELCMITKIGLDHTEYLGDTIEKIAYEKAGIIKEGVKVAFFDNKDESANVIRTRSEELNCECYSISKENISVYNIAKESIDFSTECKYYRYDSLKVSSGAFYQIYNASLAVLGCLALCEKAITEDKIRSGLISSSWSGRMEEIEPSVYLDGGHNPDGIEAFLEAVSYMPKRGKRYLLFSVVSDKQYDAMIRLLAESHYFDEIIVSHIDSKRALLTDDIRKTFEKHNCSVLVVDDVSSAYVKAKDNLKEGDELFVVGSLYLVGQILAMYS